MNKGELKKTKLRIIKIQGNESYLISFGNRFRVMLSDLGGRGVNERVN